MAAFFDLTRVRYSLRIASLNIRNEKLLHQHLGGKQACYAFDSDGSDIPL
jgi:hypothetical protein